MIILIIFLCLIVYLMAAAILKFILFDTKEEDKPVRHSTGWNKTSSSWENGSTIFKIAQVTYNGDWKESLIDV